MCSRRTTHSHAQPVADGADIDACLDAMLDDCDRRILDAIQSGFPLVSRPYAAVAALAGIDEQECFHRVGRMRERGMIRRIGANFQSSRLGFRSTLCAAKVPEEKMEDFVRAVNAEQGVTHNYLRDHEYNVWFTCIGPSWDAVCATIEAVSAQTGIAIINLPAEKLYKIKVDFAMRADN